MTRMLLYVVKARDMPRVFVEFKGKLELLKKKSTNHVQTLVVLYSFGTNLR
jgi:hypothetical protein